MWIPAGRIGIQTGISGLRRRLGSRLAAGAVTAGTDAAGGSMGKGSSKSSDAVERLLDERRKTGEFLVRLGDARDDSPEHVRNRVRQGYKKRMDEVTEELKGRRADLEKSLLAKAEIRSEIAAKARHVKERLEEAQVRRTVGEIDDAQWAKLRRDVQGDLDGLRDELKSVESDIAGLKEVLRSLNGDPNGQNDEPAQSPKAKSPKGAAKHISDSSKSTAGKPDPGASGRQPVGAYLKRAEERKSGKFTPSKGAPSPASATARPSAEQPAPSSNGKDRSTATTPHPGRGTAPSKTSKTKKDAGQSSGPREAVDELAFLKSVTEDEVQGPSPKRATGKHLQQKAPPEPPKPSPPKKKKTDSAIIVLSEENDAPQKFPCTGCGTDNPATAWYCEKCGAELTI